jgi:trans-aconitate methyltransferase
MALPELLVIGLMLALIAFLLNFEYYTRKFGVSTSHSARSMRRAIIAEIREAFPGESPLKIIDPGCGSGGLGRAIARAIPGAEVLGMELSPLPFWQARIANLVMGPRNFTVLQENFFERDFSKADVVVTFLPEPVLWKLEPKLKRDMKPGSILISNAFRMPPGWEPYKQDIVQPVLKRRLYCYRIS